MIVLWPFQMELTYIIIYSFLPQTSFDITKNENLCGILVVSIAYDIHDTKSNSIDLYFMWMPNIQMFSHDSHIPFHWKKLFTAFSVIFSLVFSKQFANYESAQHPVLTFATLHWKFRNKLFACVHNIVMKNASIQDSWNKVRKPRISPAYDVADVLLVIDLVWFCYMLAFIMSVWWRSAQIRDETDLYWYFF